MAVDFEGLINKFYNGHALSAQGPIPPGLTGYDPKLKNPYKIHDIAKAKELMKKAGYPEGEGLSEIVYETYNGSTVRQIVEFFQQNLSQIGVKLKININTWPEFLDKTKLEKHPCSVWRGAPTILTGKTFFNFCTGPIPVQDPTTPTLITLNTISFTNRPL